MRVERVLEELVVLARVSASGLEENQVDERVGGGARVSALPLLLLTTAIGTVIPLPEWAMEPWIHCSPPITVTIEVCLGAS